ncbi:hypothetical protein MUP29_05470 [bacterium]|nr:hypothetical protein [bacterium]
MQHSVLAARFFEAAPESDPVDPEDPGRPAQAPTGLMDARRISSVVLRVWDGALAGLQETPGSVNASQLPRRR